MASPSRTPVREGARGVHPVVWTGLVLVVLQLAFRGWALFGGWFYADDFEFLHDTSRAALSPGLLMTPHDTQLMPGGIALAWLVAHTGPFDWPVAAAVVLVLQAVADLACLAALRSLIGARPVILVPLAYYLFSTTTLTATMWWSAAVNSLPMQACVFGVLALHVRHLRTGRVLPGVLGAVVLALSLLFFAKSVLVLLPVVLVTLLYFGTPGEGPVPRVFGALRRSWPVWAAYAVVVVVEGATYLALVQDSGRTPGDVDHLGLLNTLVRVSLVVTALGGPWVWNDDNPPLGQVATPAWAALAALVVVVTLVAWALRRRPGAWRALAVLAPYVVVTWLLVADVRGSQLGSYAGLELRYLADTAAVVTVCAGLLLAGLPGSPVAPPGPSHRRVGLPARAALTTVGVAALVGAVVSSTAYARMWTADFPARAFVQTATGETRQGPLVVADLPVPEIVMAATSYPSNLPSRLLSPLGDRVEATRRGTDLPVLDDGGRPQQGAVSGGSVSRPGPRQGCGYLVEAEATTVPMTGDDPPYFWWTEVSYLAGGRGRVLLSLGGRDHVLDVQKGLHRFFLAGQGSVTPVTLRSDPTGPEVGVCVDAVRIGTLAAVPQTGGAS